MSALQVQDAVLAQYREGVAAVGAAVEGWADADWDRPACGVWSGVDVAGHLVTVIGWYHGWLDRGLAGQSEPAFPIAELDARTAAALATLSEGPGPDRIDAFVAAADAYAVRLAEHWDTPYGYPRGSVTAGLHAGVAAVEWHVHTWDLRRSVGADHVPSDPAGLFLGAARCQLAIVGGLRARVGLRAASAASKRDAWPQLLRRMGRA